MRPHRPSLLRSPAPGRASTDLVLPLALLGATSCLDPALTREEAQEAVDSSNLASAAEALSYDVVEISTHFTLGKAVAEAAEELRSFAVSQIPCSDVSLAANTVTIDFGGLDDACSYRGHAYGGVVQITVQAALGSVQVHHAWMGLTNGKVTVDGEADVTWSDADSSRQVKYEGSAISVDRAGTLETSGDITQTLIDPSQGLTAGIEINGKREWSVEEGHEWKLRVDGVEVRGQDPVPQAGRYKLTTPSDKDVTMTFGRIDATTIRVTVVGPRNRTFEVDVVSLGH
jgi:hypothetical protein